MTHDSGNSPETLFVLTSLTKQFTATGIMLLVQDGRLSLDDGITKYLAEVPDSWSAITVEHLLTGNPVADTGEKQFSDGLDGFHYHSQSSRTLT